MPDPTKIKRPGDFTSDYIFEWWHVIVVLAIWVLGLFLNSYLRKQKFK